METNTLGRDLRARLVRTGKSQNEIARGTGIAQSTVGRFLRDATDITLSNFERLLRFAEAHEASEGRDAA